MSKAEDLAKKYCEGSSFEDACMERPAYIAGYHQAEKENELTWDDVSLLNCLLNEVEQEFKKGVYEDRTYKGYCQEVLKRFKDLKKGMRNENKRI